MRNTTLCDRLVTAKRAPGFAPWIFRLAVPIMLTLSVSPAHGADTLQGRSFTNNKEVRYTCRNHAIDIHRLKYANATDVSEYNADWLGTRVPWRRSYTPGELGAPPVWGGWLQRTRPVIRTCALRSGLYVVKFGAWSWDYGEHWPTVTVMHDGKTVLPTTVLGMCRKDQFDETGICRRFAVRVFMFESIDSFHHGKPIGVSKPQITLYRIRKEFHEAK